MKRAVSVLYHDQNTQTSYITDQNIHRGKFDLCKGVVNLVTKALRDQRHGQQIQFKGTMETGGMEVFAREPSSHKMTILFTS